jgi:hypothetical protein
MDLTNTLPNCGRILAEMFYRGSNCKNRLEKHRQGERRSGAIPILFELWYTRTMFRLTRRWFRFSLRTLFVVVTFVAVGLGWESAFLFGPSRPAYINSCHSVLAGSITNHPK